MANQSKTLEPEELGAPKRGILRSLLRILLVLLLLGLVVGLAFVGWKFKDKIFPAQKNTTVATSGISLVPFCDSLSQNVYALKLTNGYGEVLAVLHENGDGLAQCGEGAENGYGKVVLRNGKAYHQLPRAKGK